MRNPANHSSVPSYASNNHSSTDSLTPTLSTLGSVFSIVFRETRQKKKAKRIGNIVP